MLVLMTVGCNLFSQVQENDDSLYANLVFSKQWQCGVSWVWDVQKCWISFANDIAYFLQRQWYWHNIMNSSKELVFVRVIEESQEFIFILFLTE